MHNANQDTDELSHYRISGIHGLPFEPWNGVGENPHVPEGEWKGYCVHGSTVFPTWHRLYMALFEVRSLLFMETRINSYILSKLYNEMHA